VAKSKRQKSQNSMHIFPPNAPKFLVYDALAILNRDFERVLSDLERLRGLRLFPRRWQRKFLKAWRATLVETRAWVDFEVLEVLHHREEREWARFGRIRQRSEKPSEPRADVLAPAISGGRKSQRRK
jgi:hypothetical protein